MPDDVRHPAIDKARLPSRHVTVGPERAPHRAFLYSMGLTDAQIAQPLVGVATTWNEAAPCNIALARQAQVAKKGVAAAGGTPREFTTITVTDGIAMGHAGMKSSLVSREVIADSVELTMRGHCYDALVGLAGCDKSLPGLMMAIVRLNVPAVFMYGGSILPGRFKGKDVTIGDVFEGVGKHNVGAMSDDERLRRLSVRMFMCQVEEREELIEKLPQLNFHLVFVTNEVGSGIVPDNPLARKFRDLAGWTNQRVAQAANEVILMVAGMPMIAKKGAPCS